MPPEGDLPAVPPHPSPDGFEVVFDGRTVQLLLYPITPSMPAPTVDLVVSALRRSPLRIVDAGDVGRILARHARTPADRHHGTVVPVGVAEPPLRDGAPCAIAVSLDRLAAYAVPLEPPAPTVPEDPSAAGEAAPEPGAIEVPAPEPAPPPLVRAEVLRDLLRAEGVTAGLLDEVIDAFADGAPLPDIRCVARGQLPTAGIDATVVYCVDSGAPGAPIRGMHGHVDLHALEAKRYAEVDSILVSRHPPVPGQAGHDVLGVVIPAAQVQDHDLARYAGANTEVRGDTVVATALGRPVVTPRGVVDVLPVFEVPGNLNYAVGNIEFPGDVIVGGDVKQGFSIVAGGSVTVRGLVEGASITAGHDLSVLGVVGEHPTTFEVGGNLTARYLHTTEAQVAGTVNVTGEIVNCRIFAERVRMSSQGRIVGGLVEAILEVDAGVLGAREGTLTEVRVTGDDPAAVIRGRRRVQPGVLLTVGTAFTHIEDEIEGVSFWNVHGSVVQLRSTTDLATVQALREQPAA